MFTILKDGRHDIQSNATQHNYIQHDKTQHKGLIYDTQHNRHSAQMSLSITTICIKCYSGDCHYSECSDLYFVILSVMAPKDVHVC
jgi:hypothetical protein